MADRTRVEGLARLREKVLRRLPQAARDQMRQANERNADEFMARVAAVIPRGDPKDGNLADTLRKETSEASETGVVVSIGGPAQPHPLHLEAGHRAADGTHVPGKPFWNPSKQVMKKRARARAARARSAAIKAVAL